MAKGPAILLMLPEKGDLELVPQLCMDRSELLEHPRREPQTKPRNSPERALAWLWPSRSLGGTGQNKTVKEVLGGCGAGARAVREGSLEETSAVWEGTRGVCW